MLWDNSKNSCKPEDTILPGLTQTDKPCHELGFDFKKRQCSGFISRMRWKKKKVICIMNNLTSYVLYICISTIIHIKTPYPKIQVVIPQIPSTPPSPGMEVAVDFRGDESSRTALIRPGSPAERLHQKLDMKNGDFIRYIGLKSIEPIINGDFF